MNVPFLVNHPIERALISVSDKKGLVHLGQALADRGVSILSTGGSAKTLRDAGVPVTDVSDHTGFPEIMDGRVKTLHPKIHGGLLARRTDAAHGQAAKEHGIALIDLLVVNLYPFADTVRSGADSQSCIENIDIGGPAMIRAAAKNHDSVTVVVDPADYDRILTEIDAHSGATTLEFRQGLARKAFEHTAAYDAMIATWMSERFADPTESELSGESAETTRHFPSQIIDVSKRAAVLRYGENPHQIAAFYATESGPSADRRPGVATARQSQGKPLSFNNIVDADSAFELVADLDGVAQGQAAVAIIKHNNPCGAALGPTPLDAYRKALACDPVSAFGGIVAVSRAIDGDLAEAISELFAEVVIAPSITGSAHEVFATKKNLRVLATGALPEPDAQGWIARPVSGGLLLQSRDNGRIAADAMRVVTKRGPTESEVADMIFAFAVAKHVKSNAIVYARQGATVGIGAGQMSRIDSARIAAWKSKDAGEAAGESVLRTTGSAVASDAFFPFADGLLAAAAAGATAVIQPGGSIRDEDVIAAADAHDLAMIFTGMRHFRH